MSKRIFTKEEQEILKQNPHITSCSARQVGFSADFKRSAVAAYTKGKQPSDIFMDAGIPTRLIGGDIRSDSIRRWKTQQETKGVATFSTEQRGRKKGVKMTEEYKLLPLAQQVEFLEAKLAFLNEAHHFFQESRAPGYKQPPFFS